MKIISIVNQKGGVGKTVSTVNLAIGLAREGKKVLVIDLDPQGSLTVSLGYREQEKIQVTISYLLEKVINDEVITVGEGVLHHVEGIDVIPANISLSGIEVMLVNTISRESILKEYIEGIDVEYDYCLIDCSPSLGMLTLNALTCADSVIIPLQPQYLSLKGMEQLFKTIKRVKRSLNKELCIEGILITMADCRTNYARDIIDLLHEAYEGKIRIFESVVPLSVRASEISAEGTSIYVHDPNGKVAVAYADVVKEVLNGKKTFECK